MKAKAIYLTITTWAGMSLGAQHYYAELQQDYGDNCKVELTRVLTPAQAAKANRYRSPGDFEEIRELALRTWLEHFPDAQILIEGRWSVGDPQKILACPGDPTLVDEANAICQEFEKIEGYQYRRNWDRANTLNDTWDQLIKSKLVSVEGQ